MILSSAIVHAADWTVEHGDVATFGSLEAIFTNLVQFVVAFSGIALFIMLLVGGFSFLFSGGDPKKLEQARGTITNAIIGLIVIIGAYVIIKIIEVFTGAKISSFTIGP
jgi:hypothetical protein